MTNQMGPLTNHDETESGLSNTLPGHRAGSPSLLTLLGPDPKTAAGVRWSPLIDSAAIGATRNPGVPTWDALFWRRNTWEWRTRC
jgi:hypothetical protein